MKGHALVYSLAWREVNVGKFPLPTFNTSMRVWTSTLSRIVSAGKFQCLKCDLTHASDL